MTALFRRIQPARFTITAKQIAQFLGIRKSAVVRVERWAYVLFVHRKDRGGQFISYRKLADWVAAIAQLIQACSTPAALDDMGVWLYQELKKFKYDAWSRQYLRELWAQQRDALLNPKQPIRQLLTV
jgi:hypothetical protein